MFTSLLLLFGCEESADYSILTFSFLRFCTKSNRFPKSSFILPVSAAIIKLYTHWSTEYTVLHATKNSVFSTTVNCKLVYEYWLPASAQNSRDSVTNQSQRPFPIYLDNQTVYVTLYLLTSWERTYNLIIKFDMFWKLRKAHPCDKRELVQYNTALRYNSPLEAKGRKSLLLIQCSWSGLICTALSLAITTSPGGGRGERGEEGGEGEGGGGEVEGRWGREGSGRGRGKRGYRVIFKTGIVQHNDERVSS